MENPNKGEDRQSKIEESNREFEEERANRMREESLTSEIRNEYKKMEDNLRQGLVDPEEYVQHEKMNLTSEQMAEIPRDSKSFQQLWASKLSLVKAREEAQFNKKRVNALREMTGKHVDFLNIDRVEKEIPADLIREYQTRIYRVNTEYQA